MNSQFGRTFPEGSRIEKLATGFWFTEGPVWNNKGGYLLFSDIPADRILKGKKLNSPNNVVVKSDGSVYFTDPPYGLNPVFGTPEEQNSPSAVFTGFVRT